MSSIAPGGADTKTKGAAAQRTTSYKETADALFDLVKHRHASLEESSRAKFIKFAEAIAEAQIVKKPGELPLHHFDYQGLLETHPDYLKKKNRYNRSDYLYEAFLHFGDSAVEKNNGTYFKSENGQIFLADGVMTFVPAATRKGAAEFKREDAYRMVLLAMTDERMMPPNTMKISGSRADRMLFQHAISDINLSLPDNQKIIIADKTSALSKDGPVRDVFAPFVSTRSIPGNLNYINSHFKEVDNFLKEVRKGNKPLTPESLNISPERLNLDPKTQEFVNSLDKANKNAAPSLQPATPEELAEKLDAEVKNSEQANTTENIVDTETDPEFETVDAEEPILEPDTLEEELTAEPVHSDTVAEDAALAEEELAAAQEEFADGEFDSEEPELTPEQIAEQEEVARNEAESLEISQALMAEMAEQDAEEQSANAENGMAEETKLAAEPLYDDKQLREIAERDATYSDIDQIRAELLAQHDPEEEFGSTQLEGLSLPGFDIPEVEVVAQEEQEIDPIAAQILAMQAEIAAQDMQAAQEQTIANTLSIRAEQDYQKIRDIMSSVPEKFYKVPVDKLIHEVNSFAHTLHPDSAPFQIENDDLVARLKADKIIHTKPYGKKMEEQISKVSTYTNFVPVYKDGVLGYEENPVYKSMAMEIIGNPDKWQKTGKSFKDIEDFVTESMEQHQYTGGMTPKEMSNKIWSSLKKDGIIHVSDAKKTATIEDVSFKLGEIKRYGLSTAFAKAAAPAPVVTAAPTVESAVIAPTVILAPSSNGNVVSMALAQATAPKAAAKSSTSVLADTEARRYAEGDAPAPAAQ